MEVFRRSCSINDSEQTGDVRTDDLLLGSKRRIVHLSADDSTLKIWRAGNSWKDFKCAHFKLAVMSADLSPGILALSLSTANIWSSEINCCQPILYHESKSIQWVLVYTMSPSLYHESVFISCIQFYTISPSLYHDSKSIPWILYTKSLSLYHESKSITWIHD